MCIRDSYDTKGLNDYDAIHSPAGRDLIKEFVTACNEEGILPFFYHTTLDWQNKTYNNDFKSYLKYLRDSIEILCTNYGEIGGFWFDGNWDKPDEDWEEDKLYSLIRKYQPNAIIINNTGIHKQGELGNVEIDSVTFEQGRPTPLNREGMKKYIAGEMCQTINNHWGVAGYDFNYKSVPYLIENLCACRKVGANYLLNVGPTAEGKILKMQEATLETMGEWIDIFGESIYKSKPSDVKSKGKNFALKLDESQEYLFIHDLANNGHENVTVTEGGSGPKIFENVTKNIKSITWMDNDEELRFVQDIESGYLVVNATGYSYGKDLVVRVAKVIYE
jgi:alpha-L-fucosidase